MAAAMITSVAYNRRAFTALALIATAVLVYLNAAYGYSVPARGPFDTHVIVYYFIFGALFHHWADKIPANIYLFVASVLLSYVFLKYDATIYLAPITITYAMAFFGLIPFKKIGFLAGGDYSYGLYLYGFPVTQALLAIFPSVFTQKPLLLLPTALLVSFGVAAGSWHLIEKHALVLKKRLPAKWFPTNRSNKQFEELRLAAEAA